MSSIYDLDPRIRKMLSLDSFLDNVTVYEFIEELSKDHVPNSPDAKQPQQLDPKPFIRTFESTLRELRDVSLEAASRKAVLQEEVDKYELDHSRNILSLAARTESISTQFKKLDDQVYKANSKINPLTEDLTTIIGAKERSLATISLIEIYTEFYKENHSQELEYMINGSIKDKRQCASTVAQLLSLSQKLISDDLENSQACHDSIQKYSELMENSLLEDFDHEYKANNPTKMRDIADILTDYNGGVAVTTNFVSQHRFFIEDSEVQDQEMGDAATWESLSDPNNHDGLPNTFTEPFFEEINEVLSDETATILEVFRDPVPVLGSFIERLYAQKIQSRIEVLIKSSYSASSLAYLRTLSALYVSTGSFSKDLKCFFQTNLESQHQAKLDELNLNIDQSFGDLFIQHLSDLRFFEQEKKTLENILLNTTQTYEQANEGSISGKLAARIPTYSTQTENSLANDYENLNRRARVGIQLKNFMKTHLDRSSSFKRSGSIGNLSEFQKTADEIKQEKRLSLTKTESMLKSTLESLSRIVELSPSNKTSELSLEVLEILLIAVGKSYVDLGLEVSFSDLLHQENKSDTLDLECFFNVSAASQIMYLVSTCIRTIFLPLSNNNPQVRQRVLSLTNGYVSHVELAINTLIKDTLTKAQDKIQTALSKQKKKDYLTTELLESDTPACISVCRVLNDVYEQLSEFLNGENLNHILVELGEYTFEQLFDHYKNFQVNSTGGIVATKDIISYQQAIEAWKVPSISERFALLREIANLFTIQPELLNSLTKEGQLATVKPYVLKKFISKRTDYSTGNNYIARLRGMM